MPSFSAVVAFSATMASVFFLLLWNRFGLLWNQICCYEIEFDFCGLKFVVAIMAPFLHCGGIVLRCCGIVLRCCSIVLRCCNIVFGRCDIVLELLASFSGVMASFLGVMASLSVVMASLSV